MNSEQDQPESSPGLTGHPVVDTDLNNIGTVSDVIFPDRGSTPRWAVVKTGLISGERYVPLDESYLDQEGRLVVALTKTTIKRAPRARRDHVLTLQTRRELRDYYGIAA
jgi:hypothetical protein